MDPLAIFFFHIVYKIEAPDRLYSIDPYHTSPTPGIEHMTSSVEGHAPRWSDAE
jgi:hypothetical protein